MIALICRTAHSKTLAPSNAYWFFILCGIVWLQTDLAVGQTRSWVNGLGGLWSDTGNWSGNDIPNTSVESADISTAGAYIVTYDLTTAQISDLSISNSSGTLSIQAAAVTSRALTTDTISLQNGIIRLDSDFDSRDVTLNVLNPFTNSGTISFGGISTSIGTNRSLGASFTNDGSVSIFQNATFSKTSSVVTNNGSIFVAAGKTLNLGNSVTINQNGGTINNQGSFEFFGDTLNFNGGSFSGNAINLLSSNLNIGVGSSGAGEFDLFGSCAYSGDLAAAQTVNVLSTSASGSTTTASADFVNHGQINLISDFDSRDVAFNLTGTVTNNGDIFLGGTSSSIGTNRSLGVSLINNGTVTVNQNGSFSRTNAVIDNLGSIDVASGRTLSLGNSVTVNQNGGTIDNQGSFEFFGDTLNFNGGSFSGNAINLLSSNLNIGVGSSGAGEFDLFGSCAYSGDLAAAQTVNVLSTSASGSTTTASADFVNNGQINLISDFDSRDVTFNRSGTVTNNGDIFLGGSSSSIGTNRSLGISLINNGTVTVSQNGTLSRTNAVVDNLGSIDIATGRTLSLGNSVTVNQNGGTIDNQGSFEFFGDTLNFNGGSFSGNAINLLSSTLNIGVGSSGAGEFDLFGSCAYSGDLAAAQTVNVLATSGSGSTTTASADFVNHGQINLISDFDSRDVVFNRSGIVTNNGTITFGGLSTSVGTHRVLGVELHNRGVVEVAAIGTGSTIGRVSANHVNAGIIQSDNAANVVTFVGNSFLNDTSGVIRGLGEFDFTQTDLQNAGTIAPGFSAGIMTLDGLVEFQASSQVEIELGGLTPGSEYDRLVVLDSTTLGGSLKVLFLSGFETTITSIDTFTVITGSNISSNFAGLLNGSTLFTADGLGSFTITYSPTSVVLSNFQAVSIPEPTTILCLMFATCVCFLRTRTSPTSRD